MHLLIPFASALAEPAARTLQGLALPHLARLLGRLAAGARDEGDEYSLDAPHERALAAARGWPPSADGTLPFGAAAAAADGIDVGELAWGLVTPTHWQVGREHVMLADPSALALDAAESRALFEAVRELFTGAGFGFAWGAPERWYAAHESFDGLPTASLDRAIGRNVDLWVRGEAAALPQTRLVRRLQSEVQLLLYPHPINEAREARGALTVNSFWLSGCGRLPRVAAPPALQQVQIDARLREPLLAGDWGAWGEAWQALDASALAALAARADAGEPVALTLCGERSAQRFERAAASAWHRLTQRWRRGDPREVLSSL